MPHSNASLGGRLALVDPKSLHADQQELYRSIDEKVVSWAAKGGFEIKDESGHLIGPFNSFLFSPTIASGFLEFVGAEQAHSSLDERVRQVVIVTVGAVWRSAYELYAHTSTAVRSGLSAEVVQDLASGGTPGGLSAQEMIAHRFARELSASHRVNSDLYDEAKRAFGERGLVDLVFLIGNYLITCAVLNSFEVPSPKEGI